GAAGRPTNERARGGPRVTQDGAGGRPNRQQEDEMSQYLFLYRGAQRPTAPQEMQQVMQKWMSWFQELGKQGYIKDPGQPLEPTGKIVSGKQKTVTDGPFA